MPNAYTGRVVLIVAVLYIALCSIFPRAPFSLFKPLVDGPVSLEHNLRPGIDMVGGTSLVYEIAAPGDANVSGLAQQMATSLKKRVDPNGVLGLIWRPQGDTRLEIQLPLSTDSEGAKEAKDAYQAAADKLQNLVVKPRQVISVVENLTGDERTEVLARLANDNSIRQGIYNEVASAYDALQAARDGGTIIAETQAQEAYNAAKLELDRTNVTVLDVQAAAGAQGEQRDQRVTELKMASNGFPERQAAIDEYLAAFDAYEAVRDEIADTATLKRLLQGSGVLSFHIRALPETLGADEFAEMVERLNSPGGDRPRAGDEVRWMKLDRDDILAEERDGERIDFAQVGPDGTRYALVWVTDDKSLDDKDPEWALQRAFRTQDQSGLNAVGFNFDAAGAALFGDLTGSNINAPLTTVLDDRIVSVANINSRISNSGIIDGGSNGFSPEELDYLVNTFNAGALPAQLSDEPISERTVGPQLGKDNLRAGFIASIFGVAIVGFFLIVYYYWAGLVAFIAVLMNMLIILASMAALQAPFTLAGIAGIILSLGMSVDANVLIFERLREEQKRKLSIRMSLRNAYDRAFSAIIDSNITTGITALVLYAVGSEEVKGFGLTLLIGIFASLFTALFVTKTIFGIMVDKFDKKDLSSLPRTFPKWDDLLTPKIDWMGKAGLFGLVSTVIVSVGLVLFGYYFSKGRVLDIEFAGGTTAQFELREPSTAGELRDLLAISDLSDDNPLGDAQVVSIELAGQTTDRVTWEVVANDKDKAAVTDAIVQRLGDRLNIRQAATFEGAREDFDVAEEVRVLPIISGDSDLGGLPVDPELVAANVGGVAVVLENLTPMLEATELRDRVIQERLKGYNGDGLTGVVNIDVQSFASTGDAIVFVSNPDFAYEEDNLEIIDSWRSELAEPVWSMTTTAVTNPDELQKVTNIGSQVASEFSRNAVIAVILSVLAIMIYIWVRFGDLKYSTATVVALAHDTLFCLAGLGYAHLLSGFFLGDWLLLDPFRLNLTQVAAILTVMGFSMNDTVVVFDRIRENRGKYGTLNRQIVNDSINQTLSRTLLTGGTTIVTIFVMYVTGGPGIHGFTFAMLVGIITGTYSSIAIASPILLVGKHVLGDENEPLPEDEAADPGADQGAMAAT